MSKAIHTPGMVRSSYPIAHLRTILNAHGTDTRKQLERKFEEIRGQADALKFVVNIAAVSLPFVAIYFQKTLVSLAGFAPGLTYSLFSFPGALSVVVIVAATMALRIFAHKLIDIQPNNIPSIRQAFVRALIQAYKTGNIDLHAVQPNLTVEEKIASYGGEGAAAGGDGLTLELLERILTQEDIRAGIRKNLFIDPVLRDKFTTLPMRLEFVLGDVNLKEEKNPEEEPTSEETVKLRVQARRFTGLLSRLEKVEVLNGERIPAPLVEEILLILPPALSFAYQTLQEKPGERRSPSALLAFLYMHEERFSAQQHHAALLVAENPNFDLPRFLEASRDQATRLAQTLGELKAAQAGNRAFMQQVQTLEREKASLQERVDELDDSPASSRSSGRASPKPADVSGSDEEGTGGAAAAAGGGRRKQARRRVVPNED